jgi:hypothetical protein
MLRMSVHSLGDYHLSQITPRIPSLRLIGCNEEIGYVGFR